jgi:hypothetical protein
MGMMIAVVAAGLLPAGEAWAADAAEVQDMRREVAQMRGQVQALLSAVTEATELERQRSASLSRAIKEMASAAPAPAAPPPSAPAPSADPANDARPASAPSIRPASGDEKPRAKTRRHRRSGRHRK